MKNNNLPKIKKVPDNYTAVTPWIISPSSEKLIEFMTSAFEAKEVPNTKIKNELGIVIHVAVTIGDAIVMLFDSREDWNPTPSFLNLYVEDVEKTYQKALQLGATSVTDITALWFGEKVCRILDPFGNLWWLAQRIEEVDKSNVTDVKERSSTPEAIQHVKYIQKSLDEAMISQKNFFKEKIKKPA